MKKENNSSAIHLPNGFALSDCAAQFYSSIYFSCGLLCKIVELFETQINDFVNSQLDTQLCAQLAQLAAVNGTALLDEFNDAFVEPLLTPPPPAAQPLLAADSISLVENAAVGLVDYVVDTIVGVNGSLNINRIANYFTNDTGNFTLNAASLGVLLSNASATMPRVTLTINETGTVIISLIELNISG